MRILETRETSEEKHHLGWERAVKDFKVGFNSRSSPNPDPDFADQANFHSLTPETPWFLPRCRATAFGGAAGDQNICTK